MSWLIFNHFANTAESLRANKSRNFLTILGIAIGAGCITMVIALTNGARQLVRQDLSNYRPNTILVRPIEAGTQDNQGIFSSNRQWVVNNSLLAKDVKTIQEIKGAENVAPILPFAGHLETNHHQLDNQIIIGTTPELIKTAKIEIDKGQFLAKDILPNSVVIGHDLAKQLFDTKDAVGQTFKLRFETFVVVGVLAPQPASPALNAINYNQSAIINFDTAQRLTENTGQIRQISLTASSAKPEQLSRTIHSKLLESHKNEVNFQIIDTDQSEQPLTQTYRELSNATLLVALIALVIGGIGVMNIMLVNVAERTHEIGIRRAIGATGNNIVGQFLVEAVSLSALGGLLGVAGGFILSWMLKLILPFPAVFNWELVVMVLVTTVVVGLIAGLIPAMRASTKDPIESLRQL